MPDNLDDWTEKATHLLEIFHGRDAGNDPDRWDWWGWINEAAILLTQEVRFWEDEGDG